MNTELNNAYAAESASPLLDTRRAELKDQHWDRAKSQQLADAEGLILSDAHWYILHYLRKRYLTIGLPRHARQLSRMLAETYASQGGGKYLRRLFPGGPVTQGSRIAHLRVPSNATDASHGSSY